MPFFYFDDKNGDENEKVQNATKEISKRDCIIMGDFNHGRIQW